MNKVQDDVAEWLVNGETGSSSKCMAMWLAFGKVEKKWQHEVYPRDPSDIKRCIKLLHAAPGLRALMPNMSNVNRHWAALVARWDEVEEMFLNEVGTGSAPKTYALMKSIYDAVRR